MKLPVVLAGLTLASAVSLAIAQSVPKDAAAGAQPQNLATVGDQARAMTEVPVRRVVLFSSGVGFFQHTGTVSGNAATELSFKTEQINDILKSLVVSDTSAGTVKSITYGSQNPIARTLKSFQIDISSNPTLANILDQIRGTKITLNLADEKVEGTVLGVEQKERPVGSGNKAEDTKVVQMSYVNVITSGGIRSVALDDVKKLEINDEALQKELDQALSALAQARDKDKKPVIINFDGNGDRQVTVAYLIETPIWKTSYRMILPDPTSKNSATLQGWAIVENQTDNDWKDITLDLVGGRPISFIEDLYQPLYVPRPTVQPKTYASLTPQTYEGGMETAAEAQKAALVNRDAVAFSGGAVGGAGRGGRGGGGGGGGGFGGGGGGAPAAAAPAAMPSMAAQQREDLARARDMPLDFAQGVQSIADASKVGQMFQYSVKGVTLPRQRSSMIPIITDGVPFDRVSIYNRSVLPRNPLLGVRLKNQTKDYLLAGPIAVLDKVKNAAGDMVDSYAGDATIDDVPPGQERLVSYAVDQDVSVDATKREPRNRLMTGSIDKGVLELKYVDSTMQEYVVENKGELDKQVLVEDPIEAGYTLKEPAKAQEKTDRVNRFEIESPAKKTVKLDVTQERTRTEQLVLLTSDPGTMLFYVTSTDIPAKVKDALKEAAKRRQAIADIDRKIQLKQADRSQNLQEQNNLRENIRVLPNGNNRDQAVKDLTSMQDAITQADKDIKDLQASQEKARADLEAYLSDLSIG